MQQVQISYWACPKNNRIAFDERTFAKFIDE
jgi:hypothetical protein